MQEVEAGVAAWGKWIDWMSPSAFGVWMCAQELPGCISSTVVCEWDESSDRVGAASKRRQRTCRLDARAPTAPIVRLRLPYLAPARPHGREGCKIDVTVLVKGG